MKHVVGIPANNAIKKNVPTVVYISPKTLTPFIRQKA
jgi:hypothetical protein